MKKVFQTKLKSITKVLTLVIIASLATFTGCKSYDEDINSLNTDVTALKSQLASLDTYTKAQIDAKITTLNGEITTLKASLATLTANGATDAELAALKTDIESRFVTKAALDAYKTQVTTDIAAAVAGLATKASVDAVNVEVVKVQTALSALGVSVDAKILALKTELNAKDAELATAIGAVTARVATLEGLVAANTTGVADNKAAIVALQAELTALKNGTYTKAEIDTKLAALDADLKKLGTDLKLEFEVFAVRQLSGLLFVPAWVNDGFNAVEVGYILDKATPATKALFTEQDVIFRFNPTTADISGSQFAFINNSAVFNAPGASAATGDKSDLFAAPANPGNVGGSGTFKLKVGTWSEPTDLAKTNYFALQANKVVDGKTTSVVSDYVKVSTRPYDAFISKTGTSFFHYITAKPAKALFPATGIDYQIVADNSTILDLDDVVLATASSTSPTALIEKKFEDYGFVDYKWSFSIADAFEAVDGTNQNSFVTLDADNKIKVNTGSSVIDRTPLVKVTLLTKSDKVLAVGYIKLQIVAKLIQPTNYSLPAVTFGYASLFNDKTAGVSAGDFEEVVLTWAQMNTNVYDKMGLTHNQFQTLYGSKNPTVTYSFTPATGSIAPAVGTPAAPVATTLAAFPLIASQHNPDVDTYAMKIQVNPMAKFGTYVVNYKYATADPKDPQAVITFTYTVTKPVLDKAIISAYQFTADAAKYPTVTTDAEHTVFTQGIRTAGPPASYAMELNLGEGFGFGSAALKAAFGVDADKIDPAKQEFIVTDNYVKAGVASYVFSQAVPTQTSIPALLGTSNSTGVKIGMNSANPLDVDYRAYPVNFKTTYPNGEVDNFDYTVIFKNPLTIELESTADFDLLDVVTGAKDEINLSKNYVVKMLGEVIFNKTGVTAKAADYGIIAPTMTYTVPNVTPAFAYAYSFATPVATWENAGTKLTSKQKVSDAKFVFGTSFASISRKDVVNVNPDLSQGIKRK